MGALTAVTLLLAWTLGVLVATAQRSRRNRQEADEAGEQVAAEQERTRIARDMHDVVAHSLAVVIAQSDGARLLRRTDPEAVDEALETIGSTARAALADVRVLLQQLRYEGTTSVQPGLADLDALLAQFRGSGLELDGARATRTSARSAPPPSSPPSGSSRSPSRTPSATATSPGPPPSSSPARRTASRWRW